MAKKKTVADEVKALKEKLQQGKLIIGTNRVLKALKEKRLSKVFVARNCPQAIKRDVQHYAAMVQIPFISLELDNEELGVFCKKIFFVSVLGTEE